MATLLWGHREHGDDPGGTKAIMFSGIVEQLGAVVGIAPAPRGGARLDLRMGALLDGLKPGASVAVNGVCLTLVESRGDVAAFDVVPETLRLTNLGSLKPADNVNLERCLRVGDRLDGHFVQGHVDGVGVVRQNGRRGDEWTLVVAAPAELAPYIVRKGSIAIDGVSLTIVDVEPAATGNRRPRSADVTVFSVALIPTTLERTVLGRRRAGERVNLESDILARLVVQRLQGLTGAAAPLETGITIERLRESGLLA